MPAKNLQVAMSNYQSIVPTLNELNDKGYGIFYVVNGGGQNDKEVKAAGKALAQFMEIDDLPMEEQIELINKSPIPPSMVVRTKKSLHTYWLLIDGNIDNFREIQSRLISFFGSDPSIINESRVMRLPGFLHQKTEPIKVEVIHFDPDRRYTQQEFLDAFPNVPDTETQSENNALYEPPSASQNGIRTVDHHRVNYLVHLIGKLKADGVPSDIVKSTVIRANMEMCKPPIDEARLKREVFPAIERFQTEPVRVASYNADLVTRLQAIQPETKYKWDDKGNGELFADLFKDSVRWNVTAREWYCYTGKIWEQDNGGMVASRHAKELADALMVYSTTIQDERQRTEYLKHVLKLGQLRFRKTMLEDARDKYFISADDLDKDQYLLNVQNGVIDLHRSTLEENDYFVLLEHSPDMLLTKICNVVYDPDLNGPNYDSYDFEDFIFEVMSRDYDKMHYLQRMIGYSLTGDTREETAFILYGQTTRNGKSTFVETISYMLGNTNGYAMNIKPETLAMKQNNDTRQASGDIARLNGCRFLSASEPPKRMMFDVGLLKSLLGRDQITARFLHQSEFQFVPHFKLFMNTNFLPLITDDTLFSSGRLNVITFDRHFEPQEQDKTLKDRLKQPANMTGILNWCLDGLAEYYADGAMPPDSVTNATRKYREDSDKVGNFISERLEKSEHNSPAGTIYDFYKDWCNDNGYGAENKGNFFAELRSKGIFASTATVDGRTVRNVVLGYVPSSNFYQAIRTPFN